MLNAHQNDRLADMPALHVVAIGTPAALSWHVQDNKGRALYSTHDSALAHAALAKLSRVWLTLIEEQTPRRTADQHKGRDRLVQYAYLRLGSRCIQLQLGYNLTHQQYTLEHWDSLRENERAMTYGRELIGSFDDNLPAAQAAFDSAHIYALQQLVSDIVENVALDEHALTGTHDNGARIDFIGYSPADKQDIIDSARRRIARLKTFCVTWRAVSVFDADKQKNGYSLILADSPARALRAFKYAASKRPNADFHVVAVMAVEH